MTTWKEHRDWLEHELAEFPKTHVGMAIRAALARLDAAERLIASINKCGVPEAGAQDDYDAICREQDGK
jgi:hypothetical protein